MMNTRRQKENLDLCLEQELLHELAQILVDSVDGNWQSLKLAIQFADDQWTEVAHVKESDHGNWKNIDCELPFFEMHEWLQKLKAFTDGSNFAPWNTFTLIINENGKFSIDYSWDQEYQDVVEGKA